MKSRKDLEPYSEEYEKEIKRENAYIVFVMLGIIRDMTVISDELSQSLLTAMNIADNEIGTEDLVIPREYD